MKIELFNCIGHSSSNTHELEPYDRLYSYAMQLWTNALGNISTIDPFARKCPWGTKRNDINPEYLHEYTTHCMDAMDFVASIPKQSTHIVLFDPPFSNRQSNEEYGTSNLYTNPKYISELGKECFRILKNSGYLIKCGYNTNPPAQGFSLVRIYICNFGASRNDIMISLWQKVQTTLNVGIE
jgi:hypothetical protein